MDTLLNTATLTELHDKLGDELLGITELFAQQLAAESAALTQCMQVHDHAGVARCAHTLKGSCGNMGAAALFNLAALIEKEAKAGNVAATGNHIGTLPDLVARTLKAMREQGYLKS